MCLLHAASERTSVRISRVQNRSLTSSERLALLSAWRKALDALPAASLGPRGVKPTLLFHSGDTSVAAAQELTAAAKSHGADQILIVAPCIMKPPDLAGLVKTIGAIAAKSSLPAIYYHYPSLYGVDFPMDEFLAMVSSTGAIPTLAGVKYIDSDIQTLSKATGVATPSGGTYTLYQNDPLLAGLAVGTKGAISYTTIFPIVRQMATAFARGNFSEAQAQQRRIDTYDAIISKFGGKPAARVLPQIFEPRIAIGPPRAPLEVIADDDLEALQRALKGAGFLPHRE